MNLVADPILTPAEDKKDANNAQCTILNVNGSGYSEKCPPVSGTIFSDIANAVNGAWN